MTEYVEGIESINPPELLGEEFKTFPMSAWNNVQYKVVYSMARGPDSCTAGRDDNGATVTSSNDWLIMKSIAADPSTDPEQYTARLQNVRKKASAEACTSSYPGVVKAVLSKKDGDCSFNNGICPTIQCQVAISISDENERPKITDSSLNFKNVDEDKLPGHEIGSALKALDAEVKAGLQQLTWEILECRAELYPGSGTFTTLTNTPGTDLNTNCPIKISTCDGQLSIGAGVALNYEMQVRYKLKVAATDDGGACHDFQGNGINPCTSEIKVVTVEVNQKNDPPTMDDPQIFYIQENIDINGAWVNYQSKGSGNTAGTICPLVDSLDGNTKKCGVRANDPDSNSITFVQAPTKGPFVIQQTGIKHTASSTATSRNFDGYIQFVSNTGNSNLDYESGNTQFYLGAFARDSPTDPKSRSEGETKIIVHVLDANDRPYLDLSTCPKGKPNQMCIQLNENEAHSINLRTNTQDQDIRSAWKCCDATTPYTFETDTQHNNGCTMNQFTVWKAGGFDGSMSKQAGFQVGANVLNYETNTNGCDMIITVKDKNLPDGLVSVPQYVHIDVIDINDAPTNLQLKGVCSVDENTPIGEKLSGNNCQLVASDEDVPAQDISFGRNAPPNFAGIKGTDWGSSWTRYFSIEIEGGITIDVMPNFEEAKEVKFDVTASDPLGARAPKVQITIIINDVNEPPEFSASMIVQVVDPSTITVGGVSNLFCGVSLTVHEEQTTALETVIEAWDPDKDTETSNWKELTFSLQPDYASSNKFTVATTLNSDGMTYSGTLTPAADANLDYETMYTLNGLRIGIKVKDQDSETTSFVDCDATIHIIDINEPPYINELPSNGIAGKPPGKSLENPLILSVTNVAVGDLVGPSLPIVDPDTGNPNTPNSKGLDDRAHCVKVEDGDTDWANFDIDEGCQIYVKDLTANSKTLSSKGQTYTLKVKAVDTGRSFISEVLTPLYSEVYTYHILGKENLNSPKLDVYNSGVDLIFEINEDVAGTIAQGTHTVNGQAGRVDLYKACTDENVPGRVSSGTKDPCSDACTHSTEDACNGALPSSIASPVTGCEWVSGIPGSCACRNQDLRYKIVPQSTIPRKANALEDPIDVDKNTAVLLASQKTDYESLFAVDPEIKCTLGQPNPYNAEGVWDFWPEFMDGIQGVCRAYNNDLKKANNALGTKGYLDSAHLCAERGARLATFAEIDAAYKETSSTFRTNNLLDLWDYPSSVNKASESGGGSANPVKQTEGDAPPGGFENLGTASAPIMRAWTYGGKVVEITDDADPTLLNTNEDQRQQYPVLCYVGTGFENEDHPTDKIKKANKPNLGYSIRLRCLDTAEYTVDETLMEYYPQSLTSDRYVFIEVKDVQEPPYFQAPDLEIIIAEDIGRSTHATCSTEGAKGCLIEGNLNALDHDKGDADGLVFSIPSSQPFRNEDQALSSITKYSSTSKSTKMYTDLSKIPAGHFNHELQDTWTFVITVQDLGGLTGTQKVTVYIADVNEPPILRDPDTPSINSHGAGSGIYKTYTISENATSGFVLGDLRAWDPDENTILSFDILGTGDNSCNTGSNTGCKIFTSGNTVLNPNSATYDVTGKITDSTLVLADSTQLDFETKQTYSVTLQVTDTQQLTDTADVQITVTNVDDMEIINVLPQPPLMLQLLQSQDITEAAGVIVTQFDSQGSTISGTLKKALDTSINGNTNIVVISVISGVTFVDSRDITIGSTVVSHSNIDKIVTIGLETEGGDSVIIEGTNFGVKYNGVAGLSSQIPTVVAIYGRPDQTRSDWFTATCTVNGNPGTENTQLNCVTGPGYGANHIWDIKVTTTANSPEIEGEAISELSSQSTSYATPTIFGIAVHSSISNFNKDTIPTSGEHKLVLTGTDMGPTGTKLEGYYGPSGVGYCAKNCVVTTANVKVECTTIEGIGQAHTWRLDIRSHEWHGRPSISVSTSYAAPTVTDVAIGSLTAGSNVMSTWGDETIVVEGTNFGPLFDAKSICTPPNPGQILLEWSNHDDETCTTNNNCYSYKQSLSCIIGIAHTQVICKTVPGVGKEHRFKITVAGTTSKYISGKALRYHEPVITGVKGPGAYEADTKGGVKFYIEGNYFGPATTLSDKINTPKSCCNGHVDNVAFQAQDDNIGNQLIGHLFKAVHCTVKNAQILIECTSPVGVGKNLAYSTQVGGQTSDIMKQLVNNFNERPSYAPPVISVLERAVGQPMIGRFGANTQGFTIPNITTGVQKLETVIITGLNFGPVNTGRCTGNRRPCENDAGCSDGTCVWGSPVISWNPTNGIYKTKDGSDTYVSSICVVTQPHIEMQCDLVTGAGHSHEWTVTVGEQESRTPTTSYHRPIIAKITGKGAIAGKTNGAQLVELHGENFGPYAKPESVTYGVTGTEYTPTGCVVDSHLKMTCTTVPGIGADLYWRVTVRDQSNVLAAQTSYATPFINSITPISASADGSIEKAYTVYLNVSDAGLADPITRRIVKFDTYEIPEEAVGPELTHRDGDFDIIAFRVPKLYNRKLAAAVHVSMVVFPYDKATGLARRSAEVKSSNYVTWKYDTPEIRQMTVLDHPTNSNQLQVFLIGFNFGNIQNGPVGKAMNKMEVMTLEDDNKPTNCVQLLDDQIPNGPKISFVQRWEQGADYGRYDKITFIANKQDFLRETDFNTGSCWDAKFIESSWQGGCCVASFSSNCSSCNCKRVQGRLQIKRGGESSNTAIFEQLTPQIKGASFWELQPTRKQIYNLPTLGSKDQDDPECGSTQECANTKTIQLDLTCTNCGSADLVCTPKEGNKCPNAVDIACKCSDLEKGLPRDLKIWLGSVRLKDRYLRNCPIVPGSYVYVPSTNGLPATWTFKCNVPAYQGSKVDTRIKYLGMWSEASISIYRPPIIDTLSRSMGGTKGQVDFTGDNYKCDKTSYLEIPTRGDTIKLTGHDFGRDDHTAVTNYKNNKYVSFDNMDMMPTPMKPPHGGLTIKIPPGIGGRMRTIQVTTGQYNFDNQTSNTIDVTYRSPTIVDHLVPLWRFNEDGKAGGYEVRFFGYDFATSLGTNKNALNKTTIIFKNTPCIVTYTSYKMVKCRLGIIMRATGDPTTSITVDGQTTKVYVTDIRKQKAKGAVEAIPASYIEDDKLIHDQVTLRDQEFKAQIDKCVESQYGADGLTTALNANRQNSMTIPLAERNEQQRVVAMQNSSLLTKEEKERVQCIALVQQAFDKKCSGTETDESTAILNAAYVYDDQPGKVPSRATKCWWEQTTQIISGPSAITGPTEGFEAPDAYIGRPIISRIYTTKNNQYPLGQLPTEGGIRLTVEAYNTDQLHMRAVLVDDNGILPDVWVNDGKLLSPSDSVFDGIRWTLKIVLPPGQGKIMRLKLISERLGLESVHSGFDQLGYAPPVFDIDPQRSFFLTGLFGNESVSSPTDSCERNQFESELMWAARIDGVGKQKRKQNPGKYRRKCMRHFAIRLQGRNFGENTTTLQLWVSGVDMSPLGGDDVATSPRAITFPVYNGSLYQITNPNKRGFAGCPVSSSFCFQHHHNELIVMGPEGYGADCVLWLSVAGQQVSVPFSFEKPEADYSEPNPYSANGDEITIHGQNFGGVASKAVVFVDGVECKSKGQEHATWLPEHPIKGLPYISCTATQTMAGINNMSLFIAGQQSRILKIESVTRAGVRSICKASELEEDVDLTTGQSTEFWGRIEPYRELCTKCVNGSGCNDETYDPPFSVTGFYIQELDISGGRKSMLIDMDTISKTDRITRREKRDYTRALEKQNQYQRVCPSERLLDPVEDGTVTKSNSESQDLYHQFEAAVINKRDFCLSVLPCKPSAACVGKNLCAEKYEGKLLRCKMKRSNTPNGDISKDPIGIPIVQHCNYTLQCQTKSQPETCIQALTDICQCPADWEMSEVVSRTTGLFVNPNLKSPMLTVTGENGESWMEYENDRTGSHECLKQCVRDESNLKLLADQGCAQTILEARLGAASLSDDFNRPEDSAKCVPAGYCVNSTGIKGPSCLADVDCDTGICQVFGECQCQSSPRCVECTSPTHYRRDGKCEECPKNMAVVFAAFFVGIIFLIVGMYYLDKQDFNLAFVSIPVDYFQVLALFSRADIRWPPELLEILYALRFFNFNIDVATPECLLPDTFTYEHKFFGTLLLLPVAIVFLFISWGGHCCYQRFVLNGASIDKMYSSKLVGTFLLCVYFMFLSCTTRALEVMNCSPTDPDDGWTYTDFTDIKCDGGGLCRCNDPEHLPLQLLPYAIVGIAVYTLGFPLMLFWILRFGGRKNLIKEDQILRASGVGDTLNTNGRAYYIRVKYHKMYCMLHCCLYLFYMFLYSTCFYRYLFCFILRIIFN